jgi:hypothetical protein
MAQADSSEEKGSDTAWCQWNQEATFQLELVDLPRKKKHQIQLAPTKRLPFVKSSGMEVLCFNDKSYKAESYEGARKPSNESNSDSDSENTLATEDARRVISTLSDNFESKLVCQKKILRHIIFETLVNEKLCSKRYHILPTTCKNLLQIFLKESFGWAIPPESNSFFNKGSTDLSIIELKNQLVEEMEPQNRVAHLKFLALAYSTECYLYGVSKQLLKQTENTSSWESICLAVFSALTQSVTNDPAAFQEFILLMSQLKKYYHPPDLEAFVKKMPEPLLAKLRAIPFTTLQAYYKIKVKSVLSKVLEGCQSVSEIVDCFISLPESIDLLSNYACHLDRARPTKYTIFTI